MAMKRATTFTEAEAELAWLLGSGDEAMGYRAQSYDGGTHAVWDEARIERAHMARRSFRHSEDVAKHARIAPLFSRMSGQGRLLAVAGYAPRAWDGALRDQLSNGQHGTLVGLGLMTGAAVAAYLRRYKAPAGSTIALLDFLGVEARGLAKMRERGRQGPGRGLFAPIREAASALRDEALEEYDRLRVARDEEHQRERRAAVARLREGRGAA